MWNTDWEARYQAGDTPWEDERIMPEVPQLFEHFVGQRDARVLEIGCGKGLNAAWFLQQGYRYFGLDLAPSAIEQAKAHVAEAAGVANPEAHFAVIDALKQPIPAAGAYDVVFDRGVFHALKDTGERTVFCNMVAESLKPDSIWITICGNADNPDSKEDIETYGRPRLRASEVVTQVEERFMLHYLARCRYGTTPGITDFYGWACVLQKR